MDRLIHNVREQLSVTLMAAWALSLVDICPLDETSQTHNFLYYN